MGFWSWLFGKKESKVGSYVSEPVKKDWGVVAMPLRPITPRTEPRIHYGVPIKPVHEPIDIDMDAALMIAVSLASDNLDSKPVPTPAEPEPVDDSVHDHNLPPEPARPDIHEALPTYHHTDSGHAQAHVHADASHSHVDTGSSVGFDGGGASVSVDGGGGI